MWRNVSRPSSGGCSPRCTSRGKHRARWRSLTGWHTYPERAAAGLWTTPSDLARLAIEVLWSLEGWSNNVLSPEMMRLMLTPEGWYGLGWAIKRLNVGLRFEHDGGNVGFGCTMLGYTAAGQGTVVMANGDNSGGLIPEIVRAIGDVYGSGDEKPETRATVPLDPAVLERYVGEYVSADWPEWRIVVVREGDRLVAHRHPAELRHELYPESEDTFFTSEMTDSFAFEMDEAGRVRALTVGWWRLGRIGKE